jgi:hypothetical protein
MESFLTQATVVAELVSVGYVVSSFATYAHRRLNQPGSWKARTTPAPIEPQPQAEPALKAGKPASKRKPTPVELLRQQCQEAGIKWRNAHGKNKHLKKAEMIAALKQLEQAKRVADVQYQLTKSTVPHKRAA